MRFFSHWLIMERSQNWPDKNFVFVTKKKTLRYKFYRHGHLYQSLKVLRQSFSRYNFDKHSNFLWGVVTWRDLTLGDLGLKFPQHMRTRCMIRCAKNGGAVRRRFLAIWKKTEGLSRAPHSIRAKVKGTMPPLTLKWSWDSQVGGQV